MDVNLHNPVFEICERLGLVPEDVARVSLTPSTAEVTLYKRNAEGKKYVDPVTQDAATVTTEFDINTAAAV